jgi:cbb3-type cytochrome oxidase maturation protein
MDILYLLIPMSAVLVLMIIGVFAWALHRGQFEDLDDIGARILDADLPALDRHQIPPGPWPGESKRLEALRKGNSDGR